MQVEEFSAHMGQARQFRDAANEQGFVTAESSTIRWPRQSPRSRSATGQMKEERLLVVVLFVFVVAMDFLD
jgi:hypothetical protein